MNESANDPVSAYVREWRRRRREEVGHADGAACATCGGSGRVHWVEALNCRPGSLIAVAAADDPADTNTHPCPSCRRGGGR